MSTLRISDAPLLPDVDGTEKIPTGGRGDYAISVDQIKGHIFQDVGKELVGLGNVDNTSDLDKPVSTAQQAALNLKSDKTYVDTNLDLKADKTNVYTRSETSLALSKKADLVNGVVPENQIPSSFNDVLEFTTSNLPIVGESGKIYVTTDTNRTWRWATNKYVEISGWNPDSVSKAATLPTYYTKEAGVNPVTGVADGAYYNVRSSDNDSYLVEYQNIGGVPAPSGKSYPSAAALTEVKEAIIDPVTGQASTLKVFAPSGENQEDINIETKKKLARTVWVDDYGDVGSGQEASAAFQAAVNAAGVGGIVMFDGGGTYTLSVPTNILDKQEINGNGAKLINNFDRSTYPRGTVQGLIQYGYNSVGTPTNLTTVGLTTSDFGLFSTSISLTSTAGLNIGDMISVANYSGFIIDKSETSITLDRFSTYLIPVGSTLYKVNYYRDIFIHDFEIDFNGSASLPRYGFGVLGHGGFNCRDENIKASNIGSKVVDYRRCVANKAKNISVFYGTDNFADGGHGYAVRFGGGCDNCIAERVIGTKVRHTVDLAGAQRCKVLNSEASHNDFAAFLTHASQTHFNEFIDNNAMDSGACYETRTGDTYNIIKGGKTFGSLFIDNTSVGGTTKVSGIDITNPSGVNPLLPLTFEDCKVNLLTGQTSSFIRFTGATARTVIFNSCDFTVNTTLNNSLVSSTGTAPCAVIFNNCKFNIESSSALTLMGANDKLIFNNCELVSIDQTVNLPIFSSSGEIEVNGGSFAFKSAGISFFGLSAATSKLSIYNNTKIVNASNVFRRYVSGSILNLGETIMFNSSYLALSNLNINTIGVANNVPYPPLGIWSEGSKIINPSPTNGGFIGYVYISEVWKGYGAIQA